MHSSNSWNLAVFTVSINMIFLHAVCTFMHTSLQHDFKYTQTFVLASSTRLHLCTHIRELMHLCTHTCELMHVHTYAPVHAIIPAVSKQNSTRNQYLLKSGVLILAKNVKIIIIPMLINYIHAPYSTCHQYLVNNPFIS